MVLQTIVDVKTEINESVKNLILFAEDMGSIYVRCLIGPYNGKLLQYDFDVLKDENKNESLDPIKN